MPLAWDRSMSVGVEEFDAHHREVNARTKMLGDAIGSGQREAAAEILRGLITILAAHHEDEERWMRARNYPRLTAHARAHQLGMETLERAARALADGCDNPRFLDLVERTARWLDVHLRSEDLRMGRFHEALQQGGGDAAKR
jgi:hemerythrin-like metal-binding protein